MNLSIIDQVRTAAKPQNRLASGIGAALGAFIPLATFLVAHYQHPANQGMNLNAWQTWVNVYSVMVLGGLTYSAITVFQWAQKAFGMTAKAIGFVVLLEMVMTVSSEPVLAYAALAYLMLINGVATGCQLALDAKTVRASKRKPRARKPKTAKA